jgi:2-polyprenyl-3-methyl-5-hydroxy-6-metoxy-1,4-benzoquinol methylase
MESIVCANCQTDDTVPCLEKWGFHIVQCRHCGQAYVNPRAVAEEVDDYFRGPYLSTIEEHGVLKPGIRGIYAGILDRLSALLFPGRLLDVGCAMGHFMVCARERGWAVHGVEASRYAADIGRKRWNLRIQALSNLGDAHLPDNHFDACVLIEVAEHLAYPRTTLEQVFRVLKPGGILYLTTPNFGSYAALLRREEWMAIIPTGHLFYFTFASLSRMLVSVGFEEPVNLTAPADFDAELGRTRTTGARPLSDAEVELIRRRACTDDSALVVNARDESLVVCARKPRSSSDALVASLRFSDRVPDLEGKLIATPGDGKVYLVSNSRRHWVTSVEWLHRRGMRIEDTIPVSSGLIEAIFEGSPLTLEEEVNRMGSSDRETYV